MTLTLQQTTNQIPVECTTEQATDAVGAPQLDLEELVSQHKDALVNYLIRLTCDRGKAEDLAQESFLRLFRGLSAKPKRVETKAYLYRIATNLVRNHERGLSRFRRIVPFLKDRLADKEAQCPQPGKDLETSQLSQRLAWALSGLKLDFRVPLVLREVEGWSVETIANFLELAPGTVKSRIHRGKAQLRQVLEPYRRGGAL